MQVVENQAFVRSRVRIGNIANLVSLVLLGVGFGLSFMGPNFGPEAIFFAYVAMIAALLALSFGRTFTRRWGPRFRQDQLLEPALRGLDNRHTLFNYASPDLPDHVLVGPTGLYLLVPRANGGTIRFDGRRWRRGSIGGALLRNLAEGGLGDPIGDVRRSMSLLATYLKKHGSEETVKGLEARPIIVFTNPQARVEARHSPVPVVHVRELRSVFRRA